MPESRGLARESITALAPTELAPQNPHANLAAGGDDVLDTPHARALEALKREKFGQGRPEGDGSAAVSTSLQAVHERGSVGDCDDGDCDAAPITEVDKEMTAEFHRLPSPPE